MAEQFISVGKLGKPHGISGAFRFLLHRPLKNSKKVPNYFLVARSGSFIPWFIKDMKWLNPNEGFISFEEIATPERAKEFSRNELFLSKKEADLLFDANAENSDYLIGFTASDEKGGEIGVIEKIIDNPGQILCSIRRNKGESLIPLVHEFVSKIDKRRKKIIFNLPDGLLDI